MKYATLILGTVLLLASIIITARAEPTSIPAAYRGSWCDDTPLDTWRRCRIGFWIIREKTIGNEEMRCTAKTVESKGNAVTINAECVHSAEPGKYLQLFRLELSTDGERLTMTE